MNIINTKDGVHVFDDDGVTVFAIYHHYFNAIGARSAAMNLASKLADEIDTFYGPQKSNTPAVQSVQHVNTFIGPNGSNPSPVTTEIKARNPTTKEASARNRTIANMAMMIFSHNPNEFNEIRAVQAARRIYQHSHDEQ